MARCGTLCRLLVLFFLLFAHFVVQNNEMRRHLHALFFE